MKGISPSGVAAQFGENSHWMEHRLFGLGKISRFPSSECIRQNCRKQTCFGKE
jgi:hypothetical protein